jgi:hypothetical protein
VIYLRWYEQVLSKQANKQARSGRNGDFGPENQKPNALHSARAHDGNHWWGACWMQLGWGGCGGCSGGGQEWQDWASVRILTPKAKYRMRCIQY